MLHQQREWRANILKMLSEGKVDSGFLNHPSVVTASAQRFFDDLSQTHGVIGLLGMLTAFTGAVVKTILQVAKKFSQIGQDDKSESKVEEESNPSWNVGSRGSDILKAFERQGPVLLQMVIVRTADSVTAYLSDIIRECIEAQPKLLSSKETLTYADIMKHSTLEELTESLVERTMSSVSFFGFESLADWFEDRLGISELRENITWSTINELVETRNCIVHNGCRTSAKYLRAIGHEPNRKTLNQPITLDLEFGFLAYCATAECVTVLDRAIAGKFNLNQSALVASDMDADLFGFSYPPYRGAMPE